MDWEMESGEIESAKNTPVTIHQQDPNKIMMTSSSMACL